MAMQDREDQNLEKVPFLVADSKSKKNWRAFSFNSLICIQLLLVTLYIGLLSFHLQSRSPSDSITIAFNGAKIGSKTSVFLSAAGSPYAGPPTHQLEQAWQELLYETNIRVFLDELGRGNQTSIALPGADSYLAWMEAFHQLHCVKMLRQWVYRDYYHPNLSEGEEEHWMLHADHCLELVRQGVMCHADTSLMTFEWDKEHRQPMLKLRGPEHVCSDWDDLMLNIRPRVIPEEEMRGLTNPYFVD